MRYHRYTPFFLYILLLQLFSSGVLSAVPPPPSHASSSLPPPPPPLPFKVGLILDMNSSIGKTYRTVIDLAVSDFYDAHPNSTNRLLLLPRDSSSDVVNAAASALDLLVNEEVHAILGPQSSVEATFISSLGTEASVPIVSFSATSPSLSPSRNTFFVRAAPNDAAQVRAIAAVVQAFGWRRVVPVYEDTDYGTALVPFLIDALNEVEASVPYRCALSPAASDDQIMAELLHLATLQTRVFVVHVTTPLAPRLFACISKAEMMTDGYVWIVTEVLASLLGTISSPDFVSDFMQGVLGVRPYIPRTKQIEKLNKRWRREFLKENPDSDVIEISNFGLWAYDAVWALAMAAKELGTAGPEFDRTNTTGATDFSKVGVSRTGKTLLNSILTTEFEGLGGRFRLVDGELNVTAYRIVNVIGDKAIDRGYWTAKYGLTKQLNWSSTSSYSARTDGLGTVQWPGELQEVPRGWVEPTSGRKLRIALPGPVEPGFQSFLNVEKNPATNETVATGFVIDVFEAAVQQLPYALSFEYIQYDHRNSSGDYNTLVQQVFSGNYDALVGDVTITANRSMYVDFTLPYTVSGVSMVVPVRDQQGKNTWIFLRPLTPALWLLSAAAFIFTGIVVWVLEHRINREFRGSLGQQLGTIFYFSFSTLVYAHRETITNILSKIVVIVWVFVVLILQSSYIAGLTSMLTVQQFTPTFTSFAELNKSGASVGFLADSFTKGLLLQLGFKETKLKPYRSPEEYQEALSNGSIAAVVDEIPYLKIFLKDYCDNYTMLAETYKTGGFGFVFPKGSPLVPDLSRAILNITEGDKMTEIESKWFGDDANCPNQGNTLSSSSTSLDFKSFWGLFLITGVASIVCTCIHLFLFYYGNRGELRQISSSFSQSMSSLARLVTFSKHRVSHGSTNSNTSPQASVDGNFMESPEGISYHTYGEGSPSTEHEHELAVT